MKTKLIVAATILALALGAVVWAQSSDQAKPDPRVDKLLEQNEQILKNQAELLKNQADILKNQAEMREQIDKLRTLVMTLKR